MVGCKAFGLEAVASLEGHTDRVWSAAWSPSGTALVTCSGDKTVRVWGQEGGPDSKWVCKAILEDSQTRTIRSAEWSPCGKYLATASFDATTAVWEHSGGEFEMVASLEGHENEVKSVAWNANGHMLATCSRDKSVWIWEAQPGNEFECVSVLQGHSQDVKMVRWHPSRELLVSCSYDNTIKVWADDASEDDWQCVQTLGGEGSGHSSTVWAIAFDETGDRMASCSDDCTVMVWDTSTSPASSAGDAAGPWKHLCTVSGYHDRTIFSIDWSRANGMIATGAGDDTIRIFLEDTEACCFGEGPLAYSMLIKKEKAHSTDVNCVRWHPKDPRLLASTSDDELVKIWRVTGDLPPYTSRASGTVADTVT